MLEQAANYQFVRPQFADKIGALHQGVATGLGLGATAMNARNRQQDEGEANIPIQDPGEKPVVDINQLTQAEQQDIAKYSDLEKKAKGLDETAMYDVRRSAVNETQSPIVKQAMVMGISAKDLDTYMKDIQTKGISSPSGQILKGRLGGENSAGWQEVQKKVAEVQAAQQQLDKEYSIKLKSTITQIEDAKENPQKYARKGQAAESVLKGLQNEGNYLANLAQMSPEDAEWVKQYLQRQQEKRGGGAAKGYQPQYDVAGRSMTFNKDTGKYEYVIDPQTGEPYEMNVPLSQSDFMAAAVAGNLDKAGKKTQTPPPRNPKNKPENKPTPPPTNNKVDTKSVFKDAAGNYFKYDANGKAYKTDKNGNKI